MKGVGLRLPVDRIRKRLAALRASCRASDFKAELDTYTTRTLKTAMNATPVRRPSIIKKAQIKQYEQRVNFIPSSHSVTDPCLRVRPQGVFVFFGGKWYRPDLHKVPAQVWSAYQELMAERTRRVQTSESDFVEYRAQARFLYRKTWWQIGLSLNLPVLASANVQDTVTRRRNPVVIPPKAYGVPRGGERVISYALFNPFLAQQNEESRYAQFSAQDILETAAKKNKPAFKRAVENHVKRQIRAARKAA